MSTETAEHINSTTSQLNQAIKKNKIFDPRILDQDDGSKALWTSESVELANQGLREGYKLKDNPYLKTVRGANLRKADLPFKYTEEELEVIDICSYDRNFFCNNFGKLKDGDKGWSNITLRDYQEDFLQRVEDHRWNIIMFPRQSGKTTTMVLEICRFAATNIDKDIVVIAQSDKVVNEILSKIKEAFSALPFFLQPGFVSFNKKGFVLDNGCRLSIGIASESVVQGFSLDLLYIDEFAYIKPSMVRAFWNNIYPTLINNPESRCIITSTPNGRNMFYEMWTSAEAGLNKFKPYRIYWYDVPGRDETFKHETILNVGIEGWEMGFECSFDTQLRSIFTSKTQKELRALQLENQKLWKKTNHPIGEKFNITFIDQKVIQYDLKKDYFLLSVDLGEGLEQDSTVLKLRKVEWDREKKMLVYKSIGIFRDNTISVEDFAEQCMRLTKYFDVNKTRLIVENNTYGGEFFLQIKSLQTYDPNYSFFDNQIIAKFYRNSKSDFEYGIRWDGQNKKLGVKSFSNLVRAGQLQESHYLSIEEYLNFGRQKNGSYAAQYGHDDLVMADVTMSHFVKCNNVYSVEFLNRAKDDIRRLVNDEDPIIVKRRLEKAQKEANVYKHNGFRLRNHADHVKEEKFEDIFLLSVDDD